MNKVYDPKDVETKWRKFYKESDIFRADAHSDKPKYSIVIPPPNVTGILHIGHALNSILQDILIRYKRMKGYEVLWIPGSDHAGITTQHVVEAKLAKEGITKEDLGREKFLEKMWEWKEVYDKTIFEQLEGLGLSFDLSRKRFTLDKGLSKAVKKVFVTLYNEGLIYRGKYVINWCPVDKTVLSDEEVDYKERTDKLYYIKYPIKGEDSYVVIATVRPETMYGDVAIAVNPSDERYTNIIGKTAILPLVGREIPIIADKYVEKGFGTGALKITPAHDINDYVIGIKNGLEILQVIDRESKMNNNSPDFVQGKDIFEAREITVNKLQEEGLIDKIEDYTHNVGVCSKCKTVIENIPSEQWFVKMKPLVKPIIELIEKDELKFFPSRWKKSALNWLYEIRDWCISRQLWWGHQIPVYYCNDCGHEWSVEDDPVVCPKCGSKNIRQDEDVLDTWFSSALWPFSTMGWPEETEDFKKFYPTDVLLTGFDILFFWVIKMLFMGYKFTGKLPFDEVYLHQLLRDAQGRKMSKSLGNGIDPREIIEKYGADSLRITLSLKTAIGRDIKINEKEFETYRKFINKLWNASRFIVENIKDLNIEKSLPSELNDIDKWILSKLDHTAKSVEDYLKVYEFNNAAFALYDFVWSYFCDWYIEFSKHSIYNGSEDEKRNTLRVLVYVLEATLKLLHPFIPFVTEEIWKILGNDQPLAISSWYEPLNDSSFENDALMIEKLIDFIRAVRNLRAELDIPVSQKLTVYVETKNANFFSKHSDDIMSLIRVDKLVIDKSIDKPKNSVSTVGGDCKIFLIIEHGDIEAQVNLIKKKIEKLETESRRMAKRLNNENFIKKAPREAVEETKERQEKANRDLNKLKEILADLKKDN